MESRLTVLGIANHAEVLIWLQKSLAEIDLRSLLTAKRFFPSPTAWEDQVLYFLLVDRFSDGKETGYRDLKGNVVGTGTTPLFRPADALNAVQTEADAARWRDAGGRYVGGTLAGVTSKLGYLETDGRDGPLA